MLFLARRNISSSRPIADISESLPSRQRISSAINFLETAGLFNSKPQWSFAKRVASRCPQHLSRLLETLVVGFARKGGLSNGGWRGACH